jgi:aminopeptidase YwaD
MIKIYNLLLIAAGLTFTSSMAGQTAWYYQWGLLPERTIDYLVGEASGEQAFNTITDLSEYNRVRSPEEYTGNLFESDYIVRKLTEYGLQGINIEKFSKVSSYRPLKGELWETAPRTDKIADIADFPFVLVPGSPVTDISADLVYVGDAYNGDLDRLDLMGKIVLTSARAGSVINMLIQKGIAGIVSYYSPNTLDGSLIIPDMKGGMMQRGSQSKVFIFNITPRDGNVLKERLVSGEKINVHAIIRYRTEEVDIQVPTCYIGGSDPAAGEVIISAHLFEGFTNEGANDNISGAATILEVARVLNKMITDGKISQPRRTIRFIWVPEYSGTIPWVLAHKDIMMKTLCDINLDMVGLSLSKYKSTFNLHRTSYGNAHYINDVLENFYRYVGETNRKNSVISGTKFFKRIVAPTGTDDPFYYQIEASSGGSDHDVFNDWGVQVPGALIITWPDPFYHTSEDRADKCDPTQLKRVAFITSSAALTVASAGENEAIDILGEVYGNAIRRIGFRVSMAGDEINKAGADNLVASLKKGIAEIKGTTSGEIMTLNSVTELAPGSGRLTNIIKENSKTLTDLSGSAVESLVHVAEMRASDFGMPPLVLQQSTAERRASSMVPVITSDPRQLGFNVFNEKIAGLSDEIKNRYPVSGIPEREEAAACINGKNSILDIKYLLDAQYETDTNLEGLINYFNQLKEAGFIKLQ